LLGITFPVSSVAFGYQFFTALEIIVKKHFGRAIIVRTPLWRKRWILTDV